MRSEIASLPSRMAQGGDWREFQQEISALHAHATSEEERVALLEAHTILRTLAASVFDADTLTKVQDIADREYRMFLLRETMNERGGVNPVELKRVTEREVRAGRMNPADEFHTLADAGAKVLGDSDEHDAHRCRNGDWLAYGAIGGVVLAIFLPTFDLSPWLLVPVGIAAGYFVNERERLRIEAGAERKKGT